MMADKPSTADDGTENDQLAGIYPITPTYADTAFYPATAEKVFVAPAGPDGYHDVHMMDRNGNVVASNNRPRHQIKAALAEGDGYNAILARP